MPGGLYTRQIYRFSWARRTMAQVHYWNWERVYCNMYTILENSEHLYFMDTELLWWPGLSRNFDELRRWKSTFPKYSILFVKCWLFTVFISTRAPSKAWTHFLTRLDASHEIVLTCIAGEDFRNEPWGHQPLLQSTPLQPKWPRLTPQPQLPTASGRVRTATISCNKKMTMT